MARNPVSATVRDPVCGMELDEPHTFTQARHEGQLFYFCSKACSEQFKGDPTAFMPSHSAPRTTFITHRYAR